MFVCRRVTRREKGSFFRILDFGSARERSVFRETETNRETDRQRCREIEIDTGVLKASSMDALFSHIRPIQETRVR